VRFATAFALGGFPDDAQSIAALIAFTADPCSDARDWAVFGLGVLRDADSPEIREALVRCLSDGCDDVRAEAAEALGKRRVNVALPGSSGLE
jgi:HEAT repeat protein